MTLRSIIRYGGALTAAVLSISAAVAGPVDDARAAFRSRDYAAAAKYAEQATREEPENPAGYTFLGSSRAKLGDKDGAREAWGKVLELEPTLKSVRDKQGFLNAYRSVGGSPPSFGSSSGDAGGSGGGLTANAGSDIIRSLTETNVYVSPRLQGEVDESALRQAASSNRRLVAVSTVYPYKRPAELAAKLWQALNLDENSVVVVATPKRVEAYGGRLNTKQIESSLQQAGLDQAYASGGLTAALIKAGEAVSGKVTSDRRTDTGVGGGLGFLALAGIGGFLAVRSMNRKKRMDDARAPLLQMHRETLDNISYADNYLDLLPAGVEAERAKALRASAYEKFSIAGEILNTAKTPEEVRQAEPLLRDALGQMEECRSDIDRATGGTGVAMSLPTTPSLDTDAEKTRKYLKSVEEIESERERDLFQHEIEAIPPDERGVSFFSGRPMPASELVPVTMVIQGQKRTVMATREEAAAIARGETPPVRAFDNGNGQYVPWYDNRNYDPYRDYYGGWGYGGSGVGTLVDLYLLTSLFGGGMWGGWGGWGYGVPYGGPVVMGGGYYGDGGYGGGHGEGSYGGNDGGGVGAMGGDAPIENAGGFDFFGQQDYNDTAPEGGVFGGDLFGGGDDGGFFGGGDGGSFDSGGDFGGGDFGGGDFGGE